MCLRVYLLSAVCCAGTTNGNIMIFLYISGATHLLPLHEMNIFVHGSLNKCNNNHKRSHAEKEMWQESNNNNETGKE